MTKRVVVIGDKETVTAFRIVGVRGVEVSSPKEMLKALREVISNSGDVGVVLLSEDFIGPVKDEVERIQLALGGRMVISRLPGRTQASSRLNVQDLLKKALGVG